MTTPDPVAAWVDSVEACVHATHDYEAAKSAAARELAALRAETGGAP